MEYTIDAKEKKLGRVASEAAVLLMGKNKADFQKNTVANAKVNIINASKLSIDQKKMEQKEYTRYSGHPGGLKILKIAQVVAKKGYSEILKNAIYGMLPGNKLRARMMCNLVITE